MLSMAQTAAANYIYLLLSCHKLFLNGLPQREYIQTFFFVVWLEFMDFFFSICHFVQMRWTAAWSRPTGRHGPPRPAVSSRMLGEKEKRRLIRGREATCAGRGLNCPSAPTWSVALLPLKVRKLVSSLLWYSVLACFWFASPTQFTRFFWLLCVFY